MISTAESKRLFCAPYQNRRFDSDFLTIKDLLEKKVLGDIVEYNGYYNRWSPSVRSSWKDTVPGSGGNFLSLGSHMIDQAVALFGIPIRIWADLRCQREGGILDDSWEVHLFYGCDGEDNSEVHRGGFKAILKGSLLCRNHRIRYMIHGKKGSFIKHGVDPQEAALITGLAPPYISPEVRAGDAPHPSPCVLEPVDNWGYLTDAEGLETRVQSKLGSYQFVYDSIYESVVAGSPPFVDGSTAIAVMRIIELAKESSRTRSVLPVTIS